MIKSINATTTTVVYYSIYEDNKDIIWPTIVGLFVALALGWMICRYKCSSKERSPHIVRCCPKSLCKNIRSCFTGLFSLCKCKNRSKQRSIPDLRIGMNIGRSSNQSIIEIPYVTTNNSARSSLTSPTQQWPTTFVFNNNNQGLSFPSTKIDGSQPKTHPLRRESLSPALENNNNNNNARRDSLGWPFQTTNMIFHKQISEIKNNCLFFNT